MKPSKSCRVKQVVLEILGREKVLTAYDVEKNSEGISHCAASVCLGQNYANWNLGRENVGSSCKRLFAYYALPDRPGKDLNSKRKEIEDERIAIAESQRSPSEIEKLRDLNLEQSVDKVMRDLAEEKGKFEFTEFMNMLKTNFGKAKTRRLMPLVLSAYEKAIDTEKGSYVFEKGYVRPKENIFKA